MTPYSVLFCTVPQGDKAAEIAEYLVEKGLAACVSIIPAMRSIYRWQGKICSDSESLLIMKTKKNLIQQVSVAIKSVHPYEVPEIIALDIQDGLSEYLTWIGESTV